VHHGVLDIHGKPRTPTFTFLASTADVGATQITMMVEVDWQVGEEIVIASTDYEMEHAETRLITAVSTDKKTLTLSSALKYKHYSAVETYGSEDFPMRCEVGLLTRNVKIQGSVDSEENQYGAHIMFHGSEEEGTIGRISYTEFTKVGQSTILGRYPMHFHRNGDIPLSFIKGNAVHRSFARTVTAHHVRFLRISHNVAYDVFGHTYFIEDGSESKNIVEHNLGLNTKQIWTLIATDVTAATYWITNADNIMRYNYAAGGEFYGFWYELRPNPVGLSPNPDICPHGIPMAEFTDNVAHSYRRFGFRLHKYAPR
jgi:hypothetical protein